MEDVSDGCGGSESLSDDSMASSVAFQLVTNISDCCPSSTKEASTSSALHVPLDWTVWQLLDSLLPTGGFSRSYGLEAAVQSLLVTDSASLEEFIISSLEGVGAMMLPFVYVAHKLPKRDCWMELDKLYHATVTNQVVGKASQAQGAALLRLAATVFIEIPELTKMRACARKSGNVYGHYAPMFGSLCELLRWDTMTAQRSFLFLTLRDIISAGTRLNVIGPLEAAYLQRRLSPVAESILTKYANRPVEDAFQTTPLLDTVQGCHHHLFSRLFCS